MKSRLSVHMATPATAASMRGKSVVAETLGPITSPDVLFSKLAQALEFADSFGHNWETLEESLRDVPGDVTLLIYEADTLWREAPDVAFELVETWMNVAEERTAEMNLVFVWS